MRREEREEIVQGRQFVRGPKVVPGREAVLSHDKNSRSSTLAVGEMVVDVEGYCLLTNEGPLRLEPRSWDLLMYLVGRPGQLVTKQELVDEVWGGAIVSDAAVSQAVLRLRAAMGDSPKSPKYVETVPRKGYRLVAPVGSRLDQSRADDARAASRSTHRGSALSMVGRQLELDQLMSLWADACRGEPQLVFVQGEAGIGKTAFVHEFVRRAFATREAGDFIYGKSFCAEDVGPNEAYLPVFELFGQLDESCLELLEVARGCAPSWFSQAPLRSRFEARAPGLSANSLVREVALTTQQFAKLKPCLFVVEDLQWCDQPTLDLLVYLARFLRNEPVMIIVTSRGLAECAPGIEARVSKISANRRSTCLTLSAFSEDEVRQLVAQYLPLGEPTYEKMVDIVWGWTSGDPLYAKSLLEYVLEHCSVDELAGVSADPDFESFPLPKSILDAIELKLETLAPDQANVLKAASVLGTRFTLHDLLGLGTYHGLRDVQRLQCVVTHLEDRGLLRSYRQTADAEDFDIEFAHALNRQVVYESVALCDRRRLHRIIGVALEAGMAHRLDAAAVKLGYHFAQAGVLEKAIVYLNKAARQMCQRGAYHQASRFYAKILDLVIYLPDDSEELEKAKSFVELRALVGLAEVHLQSNGVFDIAGTADRVRYLAGRLLREAETFRLLCSFFRSLFMNARADLAEPFVELITELSDVSEEASRRIAKGFVSGCFHHMRGDIGASNRSLDEALDALESAELDQQAHAALRMGMLQLRSWNALFGGEGIDEIQRLIDDASNAAQVIANPGSMLTLTHARISFAIMLGCEQRLEDDIDRLVKLCGDLQHFGILRATEFLRFSLRVKSGEEVSLQEMKCLWNSYTQAVQSSRHPTSAFAFIEACLNGGSAAYALSLLEQVEPSLRRYACARDWPEIWRLKALAFARLGQVTQAQELLSDAIALAREQGNVFWRGRAECALQELSLQNCLTPRSMHLTASVGSVRDARTNAR